MAEHPGPESFTVNPPTGNPRLQILADNIRDLEPELRIKGKAPDFNKMKMFSDAGLLTGLDSADKLSDAVNKIAADITLTEP